MTLFAEFFMKNKFLTLAPALMLAWLVRCQTAAQQPPVASARPGDLVPTATQQEVEKVVTNILSTYHYRRMPLDDSLSVKVWNNYLKDVDNGKVYLLAEDVEAFRKYRYDLDDQLEQGSLQPAYDLFNTFMRRFEQRMAFVQKDLSKPFDFTRTDVYETDRDKAGWMKTTGELDALWDRMLRSQALDLKLQGKADTAITKLLRERYTNLEKQIKKVKSDYVFQTFMNAFAEVVDPHTNYMAPPDASRFKDEMAQSFEGIGATLFQEGDYTQIRELHAGGPALKSSLLTVGDRIVGVAQGIQGKMVDVVGWAIDDVVKLIRGPKGTTVRLNILKTDALPGTPPKEIVLIRDKIKLEEGLAKAEIVPFTYQNKEYKVGVVTIPGFYQGFEDMRKGDKDYTSTSRDTQRFLEAFKSAGVDGVVVDLRYNGGGSLDEAIKLTGLFIKNGPVVQVKDASGRIDVEDDPDPQQIYSGPLAVLINRFSASASEIFAAAIQDYHRGVVIGDQTYGKGTVQQLLDLNQFLPREQEKVGMLKMTRAKFYRITGSSTQHRGVTPDIQLPSQFSAEEFGESSQPSALPWDQINTARFNNYNAYTPQTLQTLQANHNKRLTADPDLLKLAQQVADFQESKNKTQISLNEATRRREMDEAKKRKEELTRKSKEMPNPYAVVLLSDKMASLSKQLPQLVEKKPAAPTPMPQNEEDDSSDGLSPRKQAENFAGKFKDDTALKESFRVLADLMQLSQN